MRPREYVFPSRVFLVVVAAVAVCHICSRSLWGQSKPANVAVQVQDLKDWAFEGGVWSQTPNGVLRPPSEFADYYTAFYLPRAFGNLEANFQFRLEQVFCDAGIIIHARDAQHYYLVHFPTAGQQWRAKHFWVAVSRADHGGYKHILRLSMVPEVNTNLFIWHKARVVVKGTTLTVWVDGHLAATVSDQGLSQPGRVGVAGFIGLLNPRHTGPELSDRFSIRNYKVRGTVLSPNPWPVHVHPVKNWFNPCPDTTYGKWQLPPSLIKTPKGDLLLAFQVTNAPGLSASTPTTWVVSRSTDNGRHWSKPEPPQVIWPKQVSRSQQSGTLFVTGDKRLMFQDIVVSEGGDRIYIAESGDDGYTWGKVHQAKINGIWPGNPAEFYPYGPVLTLKDGTLLRFLYGSPLSSPGDDFEFVWGAPRSKAFCIRSTDGGQSWSVPIDLDESPAIPEVDKPLSSNLDLTESSCVQVKDGTVRCFIRPNNSPFMWVGKSGNSGRMWGPTTFGAFPGYAANALYTSGRVILVAHRMPDLAINTSYDDGLNWDQGTIVGTDTWAMGDMVEVAPNIALFVYMDTQQTFLRAQFIRVTSQGLEPALGWLPKQDTTR